ncbi:Coronin-like protein crn1 [Escovopsis weberi]|uniref:Coronin n=1 Tax=Escovopsis weberi TaxID=150374 RepID=A0A0M8N0A4_ESCWE|nr:Coronin-like protein crn1 [Escovopsis weberi]
MAGRFVRASKYRHVFGKPAKKESCYDNVRISRNAWDTNLVKANPEYLSVNWDSSGGGAFAVIPLHEKGKLPDQIPLFRGHTATVLDTDWNPFNDRIIASASEDGKVFIWEVPEGFSLYTDAEIIPDVAPVSKLGGHTRKVGQVLFNPAAENILASAAGDYLIKLWDVGTGQSHYTLPHTDIVQSLSWNASGNLLVTTSRDKKIRVWDVRQEKPAHEAPGHSGAKSSRVVWLGEHNRFATTGFSKTSERQLALWEPGREDPIGDFTQLDFISGVCMPFWDDGSNCLYLAGKGDGNIRYYEYENDKFEFLSQHQSPEPQRGIAFIPRRGVNVHDNEVMRAFKTINDSYIEPISFTVPRRAETFQADIFPPAIGTKPAMSAQEWFDGKTEVPAKIDLEGVYNGTAPKEVPADYKPPAPVVVPVAAPAHREERREEPAPAARVSTPPSMKEQRQSIAALASKFQDHDEGAERHDEEPSSFDEETRPAQRHALPAHTEAQPVSGPSGQLGHASHMSHSTPSAVKTFTYTKTSSVSTAPPLDAVETSLNQIKELIENQTRVITAQNDKIGLLTTEVESLKKKLNTGSNDRERIRQLELELEEARS